MLVPRLLGKDQCSARFLEPNTQLPVFKPPERQVESPDTFVELTSERDIASAETPAIEPEVAATMSGYEAIEGLLMKPLEQ